MGAMRDSGPDAGRHRDSGAPRHRPSERGTAGRTHKQAPTPETAVPTRSGHITAHLGDLAARHPLRAAIEQVTESVIITDLEARITYVNPAFERVTGYGRDEVMGKNPRFLKSGLQTPWFYDGMWAALTNGLPWSADFINQRKDGSLYTESAVISPIRDPSGAITSYVAVQRDLTHERALAERASQLTRERALIADTIRGLSAGDTPEATAQAICRRVVNLTGVTAAQLALFELEGHARAIGFVVEGQSDPPLRRLPEPGTQLNSS